jgi:Zn-dependent peptidase ImmA (M78 family)
MKSSLSTVEIENKAALLLIECKVYEPFVPIEQIVMKKDIHIVPYDFDDEVSGVLVIKDNVATIGYNKANSKERIRFTIAHELAHHTLHWKPLSKSNQEVFVDKDLFMKFRNTLNEYNKEEILMEQQANAFAAALLMPKHFIEKELNKVEYQRLKETDIIQKLASRFKVSEPAMTYRLANLQMFY